MELIVGELSEGEGSFSTRGVGLDFFVGCR